jgi:uncharacterized protein YndB with AHSA1/START domain
MAEATSSSATGQARQELVLTRIFGAPRSLVFRTWTDPKHLARWWGPRGFTNPVYELDVRPGGLERLDFTSTALEDATGRPLLEILNTITFDDYNGLTKLTLHAGLVTKDFRLTPQVAAALSGMEQGWSESLYRLADELENALKSPTADRLMVTTRVINAPRALVFEAWTKAEHSGNWWGPRGFHATTQSMDVRPGEWRFVMHADGADYKNRIVYLEVAKPQRLVYNHFGEEGGEEEKLQTTVTFLERGATTEVLLRALFPTVVAREFVVEKHGAIEGGKQTLERLAEFVGSGSVRS